MKEEDYTIENLENTFLDHHRKALQQYEKQAEEYEEVYLSKYPHEFFSISLALHEICKEIKQIKDQMNSSSF